MTGRTGALIKTCMVSAPRQRDRFQYFARKGKVALERWRASLEGWVFLLAIEVSFMLCEGNVHETETIMALSIGGALTASLLVEGGN